MRRNGSISLSDAKIWHALRARRVWMTNVDIAKAAAVSERTTQNFTRKYAALGVLDCTAVCPAYFRIPQCADSHEVRRFEDALDVYGLDQQCNAPS